VGHLWRCRNKFFHANATIRYRQNLITTLQTEEGIILSRHEEKANLLWEAYKDRLGKTEFSHMYFDLHSLLNASIELDNLEEPFLKEEIDGVVVDLPSDKSPRPNGINGDFLRKCWLVVA
jgi:hypothetical protein